MFSNGFLICICLVCFVKMGCFNSLNPNKTTHYEHTSDSAQGDIENGTFTGTAIDTNEGANATIGEYDSGLNETMRERLKVERYNNMLNDTWLNLVTVLDLYTRRAYDNESAVQALLAAYRYTLRQQKKLKQLPSWVKKPFVTIEGMDRGKRNALAQALAKHMGGYMVLNPPNTFDVVLKNLPANNTKLTNGFHVLSTYISALHVRSATQTAPAIIAGYWLGRAAYTIARNFLDEPPPYESKFWVWPRDLVKPDIVFYITDRFSINDYDDPMLVKRYLHVFDNWLEPKCVPLVNTQSVEAMVEEIQPYLDQITRIH